MPYADIEKRREVKRNYMKRYRAENAEAYREYMKLRMRKLTPEQRKQKRWAYKAKLKNAPQGFVSIKKLKEEWDNICGICKKLVDGPYDIDHIVPLSRGGAHTQANLQLTHPFCNRSKGNRI